MSKHMNGSNFVLVGSFRQAPETNEFYGMVCKQDMTGELTILTVGVEDSEYAIMQWVQNTIAMMRAEQSFTVQAADKYDRMKKEQEALKSIH